MKMLKFRAAIYFEPYTPKMLSNREGGLTLYPYHTTVNNWSPNGFFLLLLKLGNILLALRQFVESSFKIILINLDKYGDFEIWSIEYKKT